MTLIILCEMVIYLIVTHSSYFIKIIYVFRYNEAILKQIE